MQPPAEEHPESEAVRVARISAEARVRSAEATAEAAAKGSQRLAVAVGVGLACIAVSIVVSTQLAVGAGPKMAADAVNALVAGLQRVTQNWVEWVGTGISRGKVTACVCVLVVMGLRGAAG